MGQAAWHWVASRAARQRAVCRGAACTELCSSVPSGSACSHCLRSTVNCVSLCSFYTWLASAGGILHGRCLITCFSWCVVLCIVCHQWVGPACSGHVCEGQVVGERVAETSQSKHSYCTRRKQVGPGWQASCWDWGLQHSVCSLVTQWFCPCGWLVAWHSGRMSVSDRRTFTVLRSTCGWQVTTYVGKPSAVGQPTRPTQPFIFSG